MSPTLTKTRATKLADRCVQFADRFQDLTGIFCGQSTYGATLRCRIKGLTVNLRAESTGHGTGTFVVLVRHRQRIVFMVHRQYPVGALEIKRYSPGSWERLIPKLPSIT